MINEELDSTIGKLYKIERKLNHGAYGIVWRAVDKETKNIIALKKICGAFQNPVDARRTYREVMLLREFADHPNIVKLLRIYKASNNMDFYLAFEYMDADLHFLIGHGVLKEKEKRFIMYQIIKAVLYIHSGNVIHRDIKPSNILIDTKFRVKIADFGLARSLKSNQECEDGCDPPPLTDYVVSRWYRAPELLLGSTRYTRGVDMWSLGCVLGEMLIDKPLFPGTSTLEQMELILATIKPPTSTEIEKYFPNQKGLLLRVAKRSCPLKEMLKHAPSDGVDLVSRLLVINPCRRLICEEALYHSYVERFEEKKPVPMFSYDDIVPDDIKLTIDGYRYLLYELVEDMDREEQRSKGKTIKKVKRISETKSQVFHYISVSSAVSEDDLCAEQGCMKEDNTAHQVRKPSTYPEGTPQKDVIEEEKAIQEEEAIHCHKKALINAERLENVSNYNLPLSAQATLNQDSSRSNIQLAKDSAKDEDINEENCLKKPCMDSGDLQEEDYSGEEDSIPYHRKHKICSKSLLKVNSYKSCRADIVPTHDLDSSSSSIQLSKDTTKDEYMIKRSCMYSWGLQEEEDCIPHHSKHKTSSEKLLKVISYKFFRTDTVVTHDLNSSGSSIQLSEAKEKCKNEKNCLKKPCKDSRDLQEEDYSGEEYSIPCDRKRKIYSESLLKINSCEFCRADIVPTHDLDSSASSIQLPEDTSSGELQEEDYLEEEDILCHRKPKSYPESLPKVNSYESCRADLVLRRDLDSSSSRIQLSEDTSSGELQEKDYLEEEDILCHRKPRIYPESSPKVNSYESCRADLVLRQDLDSSGSRIQLSEDTSIQLSEDTTNDEYMNEENCCKNPCIDSGELQEEDYLEEEDILCHRKPKIYPESLPKVNSYESCRADLVLRQDLDSSGSRIQLSEDTSALDQSFVIHGSFSGNLIRSEGNIPLSLNFNLLWTISPPG